MFASHPIACYLEDMAENERADVQQIFYVTPTMKRELKVMVARRGTSVSALLRELVQRELDKETER